MFKPKIKIMTKFVKFITFGWASAITLCPFGIYVKEQYLTRVITINHEKIHWQQQLEMLIIFFYLWYLIEWLIRLPINGKAAYRSLSMEREGWANRENLDYLKTRKPYALLNYMKKAA